MAQGTGRLAGRRALITGGAGGIGRATAAHFLRAGARVAVSDLDGAAAMRVAEELGGGTVGLTQDVSDPDAWPGAVEAAADALGGLDILVNNAGIGALGGVLNTSFETWRKVHAVDLDSVFLGCKTALPYLEAAGEAAIVNISSVAGLVAQHNLAAYNSAKAGVRHLTKSVALECAKRAKGVRCNAVMPAFLDTAILDGVMPDMPRDELLKRLASLNPMNTVGDPEDAAYAIVYLASREAKFVNGTEIVIDGGLSAM